MYRNSRRNPPPLTVRDALDILAAVPEGDSKLQGLISGLVARGHTEAEAQRIAKDFLGVTTPRRNPKLNFKQAWTKARAEKKALLSPDGRVLEPVLVDDDYGPAMNVAYYDTGRLASGSFDGNWEVVAAPS
jgi:hypothetical protein